VTFFVYVYEARCAIFCIKGTSCYILDICMDKLYIYKYIDFHLSMSMNTSSSFNVYVYDCECL
jgi:hypothetical protein